MTGNRLFASNEPAGQSIGPERSPLQTIEGCREVLNELLETPPQAFGGLDLGLLNLVCAPSLPGSESLDIPKCLARLECLTHFVKSQTEQNLHRRHADPEFRHSESMWRMAMLVTLVKRDFGASYSPSARDDLLAGLNTPFSDSREAFIHGLLDGDPARRWGTCTAIPVLIVAVARRLRYPVSLAVTRTHVYARWENGEVFNIEASNPAGMTSQPDDYYRSKNGGLSPEEEQSGHYLRTLFPVEEFALFLQTRVWHLRDAARYDETLLWAARALQFCPTDPYFPKVAHHVADLAMKHRLRRARPEQKIPSPEDPEPFFFNVGDLLALRERSLFFTIVAHYKESLGELVAARQLYEDACRQNFHGNNEQRDLQRFLRKHKLPPRKGTQFWPANIGLPRWIKVPWPPEQEESYLVRAFNQRFRDGQVLMARDALRDLYMFDPGNAELFQRARDLEQHPMFQPQLKAYIEQRRRSQQN